MIGPQHDLPDSEALVEVCRCPVEFAAGEMDAGDEMMIGGDAFREFPAFDLEAEKTNQRAAFVKEEELAMEKTNQRDFDLEAAANLPLQHVHRFRRLRQPDEQLGQRA